MFAVIVLVVATVAAVARSSRPLPFYWLALPAPYDAPSCTMPAGKAQQCLRRMCSVIQGLSKKYRLPQAEVTTRSRPEDAVKAYRRLCVKVHPDKAGGNADNFQGLHGAYTAYRVAAAGPQGASPTGRHVIL